MALTWDVNEVKEFKETGKIADAQLRDLVIYATMFVGISRITEKNWRKFYARMHAYEKLGGAFRWDRTVKPQREYYMTEDEVYAYVGLHTNASDMTDAQFRKKLWEKVVELEKTAEVREEVTDGSEETKRIKRDTVHQ